MNIKDVQRAAWLAGEIERLQSHAEAFGGGGRITLAIDTDDRRKIEPPLDQDEIRRFVAAALISRLDAMRAELRALGVEVPEPAPEPFVRLRQKPAATAGATARP